MDSGLLMVIVGVILFLTAKSFKEYFESPQARGTLKSSGVDLPQDSQPFAPMRSKVEESEFGVIAMLMAKVARADGRICELEEQLVENMIEDLSGDFRDKASAKQELHELFMRESKTGENVEFLAHEFARLSKGEYRKQLKLIEFLFTLAYADGELDVSEREVIIDIAAYLRLENEDFNKIYDDFEGYFSTRNTSSSMKRKEALALFGLSEEEASLERIKKRYRELVRENHPDILQGKGFHKSLIDTATKKLQEINDAYEILRAGQK